MSQIVVSALYHFVKISHPEKVRTPLLSFLEKFQIRGTLILAEEGINGTVSGSRESIDELYKWFAEKPEFKDVKAKESFHEQQPFYRTKVKVKKEIVTMGVQGIDPQKIVGTYVKPEDWNDLISDPDVILVDTRNDYEYQIGSFKGACNPNTESFRQFPEYVKNELNPTKQKKVAMFCTGGIRCEKSTAYLKEQGFEEVFHLQGGILKYLENIDAKESLWNGECFVFDNRVSVGHGLKVGDYELCHACRKPLSLTERTHKHFQEGVSCHHCFGKVTEKQKSRFEERQRQVKIAKTRGEFHIGSDAKETNVKRRELKTEVRLAQRKKNKLENES